VLNRGRLAISISVVSATLPHHNMNKMNGMYRMNSHTVARVPRRSTSSGITTGIELAWEYEIELSPNMPLLSKKMRILSLMFSSKVKISR
jgi:hypothetical protein